MIQVGRSTLNGIIFFVLLVLSTLKTTSLHAHESSGIRVLSDLDRDGYYKSLIYSQRGNKLRMFGRPNLEIAGGVIANNDSQHVVASVGAVWQRRVFDRPSGVWLAEIGFAPTLLSSAKLNSKDLGGLLHFTTSVGLGWQPRHNRNLYIGFRFQHISNGSIHKHNPGLDMLGIEIRWHPRR